ncbi:uncharacterized protein LOC122091552 [Macadamia integrifolia]|uniref:uncharacterized protein LOC122091552 n=1 Tax=Macadamia integrifolia TaxID=60698 RepID=UPI001C4E3854|nr:uncharacterized protein LOC122091552 [Macadamia integrifolia]
MPRQLVWDTIISFSAQRQDNWVCLGDFNSYLAWYEKRGGNFTRARDIAHFRGFLNACQLLDIGAHGPAFTWNNRCKGDANIRVKLDRGSSNEAWRNIFEDAVVTVWFIIGLDHLPLVVDTEGSKFSRNFERIWFSHLDCKNIVAKAWSIPSTGTTGADLLLKTKNYSVVFSKWNKEIFGNVQLKIRKYLLELE